jgi:predicted Ser/Thr protein kinase
MIGVGIDDETEVDRVMAVEAEPRNLGRYVLLDRLGAGAMGTVHSAWDRELERRVALKLLHRGHEPARFQREAQALAKLKHPNVVTVYDVGRAGGDAFIAMELVDGMSLRRWLGQGPRDTAEVLRVLEAAGRGLAAVHAVGLVHRDFKPDNVLVGADGIVRVVDFGLARLFDDETPAPGRPVELEPDEGSWQITHTGTVMGTPRYMAPEQRAARAAEPRADQYAFCVTAWEALYGEHPVVHDRPFSPARGKLGARLRAVLQRGMAQRPSDRWPSMDALLAAMAPDRPGRRFAAAGAAVVLVAVAVVVALQSGAAERACAVEEERLPLAWGDAERAAVRQAFLATGAAGAAAAADSTTLALDRYQDSLRAMAGDACRAARVRGSQSEPVRELRAACVARRGLALGVLVDELEHADRKLVGAAGEAARALPPVAECGEVAALTAPTMVPADPSLRAPVAAVWNELSALTALELAGRYRLALVRSAAAVPLARLIGFRPLISATLLQLSSIESRLDDHAAAEPHVEDALYLAEASGDDVHVAEAATELAFHGYSARKLDAAHRWMRLAEAALDRLGQSPTTERLRAALEVRQAGLALVEKNAAAAEEHGRRALALLARTEPGSRRVYRRCGPSPRPRGISAGRRTPRSRSSAPWIWRASWRCPPTTWRACTCSSAESPAGCGATPRRASTFAAVWRSPRRATRPMARSSRR